MQKKKIIIYNFIICINVLFTNILEDKGINIVWKLITLISTWASAIACLTRSTPSRTMRFVMMS